MLTRADIEEVLEKHPRLRPPLIIYILDAPIVYPELAAIIYGMNPALERKTIILANDATPRTVIHETFHRMGFGEILTSFLTKRLIRFRQIFPALRRRRVEYDEEEISSEELERYGLRALKIADRVISPTRLRIKKLTLRRVTFAPIGAKVGVKD